MSQFVVLLLALLLTDSKDPHCENHQCKKWQSRNAKFGIEVLLPSMEPAEFPGYWLNALPADLPKKLTGQ